MSHMYGGSGAVAPALRVSDSSIHPASSASIGSSWSMSGISLPGSSEPISSRTVPSHIEQLNRFIPELDDFRRGLPSRISELRRLVSEEQRVERTLRPIIEQELRGDPLAKQLQLPEGFSSQSLRSERLVHFGESAFFELRGEVVMSRMSLGLEIETMIAELESSLPWLKGLAVIDQGNRLAEAIMADDVRLPKASEIHAWIKEFSDLADREAEVLGFMKFISGAVNPSSATQATTALLEAAWRGLPGGRTLEGSPVFEHASKNDSAGFIGVIERELGDYRDSVLARVVINRGKTEYSFLNGEIGVAVKALNWSHQDSKRIRRNCGPGRQGNHRFSNLQTLAVAFSDLKIHTEIEKIAEQRPELLDNPTLHSEWLKTLAELKSEFPGFEGFFPELLSAVPVAYLLEEGRLDREVLELRTKRGAPDQFQQLLRERLSLAIEEALSEPLARHQARDLAPAIVELFFSDQGKLLDPPIVDSDRFRRTGYAQSRKARNSNYAASLKDHNILALSDNRASLIIEEGSPLHDLAALVRRELGESKKQDDQKTPNQDIHEEIAKKASRVRLLLSFLRARERAESDKLYAATDQYKELVKEFQATFLLERQAIGRKVLGLRQSKRESTGAQILRTKTFHAEVKALLASISKISDSISEHDPKLARVADLFPRGSDKRRALASHRATNDQENIESLTELLSILKEESSANLPE